MAEKSTSQPAAQGAGGSEQPKESSFKQMLRTVSQTLFFFMVMKMITSGFGSKSTTVSPSVEVPTQESTPPSRSAFQLRDYASIPDNIYYFPNPIIPVSDLPDAIAPLWPSGSALDISIYISEDEYFQDYNKIPDVKSSNIQYGEWFEALEYNVNVKATKTIQNNGTVYAHIFITQEDTAINPRHPSHVADKVVYQRHMLTKLLPQKTVVKQKNLLKKSDEEEKPEAKETPVEETASKEAPVEEASSGSAFDFLGNLTRRAPLVTYWQHNFTLTLVSNQQGVIPKNGMQAPVLPFIPMSHSLSRDAQGKVGFYRPIAFPNDFWQLRQNAYPVNDTVNSLPLIVRIEPISMWKFNIYATLDESMKQQANSPLGGMSPSDMDEIKRMFIETNPILLGTTIFVSLLHSLFEMLAFKNDISFWKKKNNAAGISVRTLLVNIFFQIVIFLYLMDNSQETSWMILISQGFGLLLEVWKVFKALQYELIWTPGSLIPKLKHQPKETTEEEDETAKYDAIAFKYLIWAAYPLLGGYAVYSLLYDEHKSWYSFVLKTLVEFVYMFGFITMLPQLYINYKLKSVAHMPWKTLMYKSLNTFIDDLFAFVVKMPTLHRLACLRDDFVFFVYLYQRHAYKVDPKRANEYGQVAEEAEEEKETKKNQ
ncbi:cleft lip and palate transmembrane protein 1-domain-containing protein [Sporodiniella umbellata]|nr:cleft lip and palate transmembrane protein 1-domain-containing protein [Sporodiniella umbellata]